MSLPRPILNPDLQRLADLLIGTLCAAEFAARGTGRTTRTIERATSEHRLIAPNSHVAKHLHAATRAIGVSVRKVIVADPKHPLYAPISGAVIRDGTWPTLPDHTWVEARLFRLIEDAIEQVQYELDQVDLPQTPAERAAQRQNFLAREAGYKPEQHHRFDWSRARS